MTNLLKVSEETSSLPFFLSISFEVIDDEKKIDLDKLLYSHKEKQSLKLFAKKTLNFIIELNKNNSLLEQSTINNTSDYILVKSFNLTFHNQLKRILNKLNEIYISPNFSSSESKNYLDDTKFINHHLEQIFSFIHLDLELKNENSNHSKKLKI